MRFTVKPNVRALCIGGGGDCPNVPMDPIHPRKINIAVPKTSAVHIVNVP